MDPTTVGPYRLVQQLGEGGMGVVHLALDPQGRTVALKVLRAHVAADPEARRRLAREVATLRRVRDPRVAEVLDADVAGQVPYLVTRYVPGVTLDQYVRERGPLPPDQAMRVARGLAEALLSIHAVGVVHRDLKPANVMFVVGEPVIIDFGIAHLADESRITMTGLVMGTPGYLSPEMIEGEQVSTAADWWGWASTVAFAASGRPPFGTGPVEVVLDRVRRGRPDLNGIEPRLQSILAAVLTVEPGRRAAPDAILGWLGSSAGAARAAAGPSVSRAAVASAGVNGAAGPMGAAATAAATAAAAAAAGANGVAAARPGNLAPTVRTGPPRPGPMPPTVPAAARAGLPATVAPNVPPTMPYPEHRPVPTRPYPAAYRSPGNGAAGPPGQVRTRQPGAGAPVPGGQGPAGATGPGGTGQAPAGWEPPSAIPPPVRPTGTLLLAAAALVTVAAVAPGGAIVLSLLLMVLARIVDRSAISLWRRRQAAGPRQSDVAVTVLALPWRLVQALFASLLAMLLPLMVAASVAFIAGMSTLRNGVPRPGAPGALAVSAVAALITAWWGPGGGAFRRGSRAIARVATRGSTARIVVWAVLALIVLSALIVAGRGGEPDWSPLQKPQYGSSGSSFLHR